MVSILLKYNLFNYLIDENLNRHWYTHLFFSFYENGLRFFVSFPFKPFDALHYFTSWDLIFLNFQQSSDFLEQSVFDHFRIFLHVILGRKFVLGWKELLWFEPVDFLPEGRTLSVETFNNSGLLFNHVIVVNHYRGRWLSRRCCLGLLEPHELICEIGPFNLHENKSVFI